MRLRAATFIPIRKNTPSCFASLFRDAGRKAAARDGRPNLAAFRPTMGGRNSGVKTQKKQAISDGNRLRCLETAVSGRYSSSRFMCAT